MTQGAQRSLRYPDISPLDGKIHVFPTLGTFLWYLATRVFYTATEYPIKYCIQEILSSILYPIEYSYDYTEVPAGYPTFSIACLIYSTSHHARRAPGLAERAGARRWVSNELVPTENPRRFHYLRQDDLQEKFPRFNVCITAVLLYQYSHYCRRPPWEKRKMHGYDHTRPKPYPNPNWNATR